MLTIDANVWISIHDKTDAFHVESARFLSEVSRRRLTLFGPRFLLTETACAIARRTRDARQGAQAWRWLVSHPLLTLEPMTDALLDSAASLGATRFLRGADALYAATAGHTGSQLITWDNELAQRGGGLTPSHWLVANP